MDPVDVDCIGTGDGRSPNAMARALRILGEPMRSLQITYLLHPGESVASPNPCGRQFDDHPWLVLDPLRTATDNDLPRAEHEARQVE
jgi:hypothetical protein